MNLKRHWPILLCAILMALPMVAYAQTVDQALSKTFEFFSIILTGMQAVLWPILLLMGGLMNNDLLFSGGMATILLNIWSAVRDFVNIMFVLGLLLVAIINILGIPGEDYTIKKALPKIAFALIAVNFSFLACKVILDVVNVTTTAIYAIPMASDGLKKYSDPAQQQVLANQVCNKMMSIKGSDPNSNPYCESASGSAAPASSDGSAAATPTTYKLKQAGIDFFSNFNSRNSAMVIAVELMDMVNLDNVGTQVKDTKSLTIQTIFSIVFFAIYASAFIALFCVLLVRVVVLWISIAISPLSFLGIAFASVKKNLGENDPFFSLFMKHAFAPLKVAIVLTIGMIMVTQLKQISPGVQYSTNPADFNALTSSASTLQDLIAGLATAAFIWIAAFDAMKGTKADPAVNWIRSTVGGFGKNLARVPLYLPLIPQGTAGKKVSFASLAAGGGPLQQYLDKRRQEDAEVMGGSKAKSMGELNAVKTEEQAKKAIANTLSGSGDYNLDKEQQAKIAELLEKYPNLRNKFEPPKGMSRENFLKQLKAGEVKPGLLREFYEAKENKALGFVPDALDSTKAVKEAKESLNKAKGKVGTDNKVTGTGMKELDDAATTLNEEVAKLSALKTDPNATDAQVSAAMEKVREAKTKVDKLTDAKQKIGSVMGDNFSATSVVSSTGKITNKDQAANLKKGFDSVAPTEKAAARNMLIEKFKKAMPGVSDDDIGKLVDDITVNGAAAKGLGAAPAAPGAPGVPGAPAGPGVPPVPPTS